MKVGERDWALFLGLPTYFTGKPCKRGHVAPRRTMKGVCVECQRIDGRIRERDPVKAAANRRRYRARHPEVARAYEVRRGLADPKRNSERWKAYARRNPGIRKAKEAARRAAERDARCSCCTAAEIGAVYARARFGIHEVDHIVPLALGGAHCAKNLQVLTIEAHRKKTARDMLEIRAARV